MIPDDTSPEGSFTKLVDEQLELAAAQLPPLAPGAMHPSPADHDERSAPHTRLEDVLLCGVEAPPEMLEALAAIDEVPALSDEELARQALADGGRDGDPATPE